MIQEESSHCVSAAEITRNFGMWQDRARQGPLVITHHGRPRVMIMAVDHYQALAAGHRDAAAEGEDLDAARLAVLLGQIGGAFVAFDTELRCTRLNAAAIAHFAQPEERLIGRSSGEIFAGKEATIAGHLRLTLRTGEEMQVDMPAGPQGERLMRLRIFPWPGGVAMTFRIVTGLHNAKRAEQEQQAQVQARLAHGGVGVGRLNLGAAFDHAEPPLAAMAGFTAERLKGVRFPDLLSLSSRTVAAEAIQAVLTGQGARVFDGMMLVDGGGELPVHVALAELRDGFAISGVAVVATHRCDDSSPGMPGADDRIS